MKPIKTLGLAMVAAIAAMAMFGAANASAVTLCKVANETPCKAANQYALPHAIEATLQSKQATLGDKFEFLKVSCQKSTVKGEAEKLEGTRIIGKITETTWTECTDPGGGACTVKAIQLPWTAHLVQKEPEEQNNGNMYVGEQPGKGQPGAEIKCPATGFNCTYKVKETQPGYAGEWAKLQVLGGNPAQVVASNVQLKRVAGEALKCPEQARWDAEYSVTNPNPLYITQPA